MVAGDGSGSDIRYSIGGIYTGTAADYANRSRQGGKDDGPSLKKIGSDEHIRVDHKWTDGQLRFSRGSVPKDEAEKSLRRQWGR